MDKVFDSATDCRLLYNSPAQNKSTLIVLRSKLSAIAQRLDVSERNLELEQRRRVEAEAAMAKLLAEIERLRERA